MVYDSSTSLAKFYVNGAPAVSYNQQDTTPATNTLSAMTNTWVGRSVQSPTPNNMKLDQGVVRGRGPAMGVESLCGMLTSQLRLLL